ncbi:MAG: mannosyltransferase family protein [Cyanobacteria bacterium P01_H01_bin.121]
MRHQTLTATTERGAHQLIWQRWQRGLWFASLMWLGSRLLILLVMLGIAPLLEPPPGGELAQVAWTTLAGWDGNFYREIATQGYSQAPIAAFFPLFPVLIWLLTRFSLTAVQAGVLLNSVAFWGALLLLYIWVEAQHDRESARWATAFLAWCPFSLFGTVIYTEGLFLVLTTAALRAFECRRYAIAGVCGALASATRLPGIVLVPTFILMAWRSRRSLAAYGAALVSSLGLVAYILYNWLRFGDPLFFLVAQQEWNRAQAFWGQHWAYMLGQISLGTTNLTAAGIVDLWHPLSFIGILGCLVGLGGWRSRHDDRLSRKQLLAADLGLISLGVLFWLLGGDPLINTMMVIGGISLLGVQRKKLSPILLIYGVLSFVLLVGTGRTASLERYAYGIISLPIALALTLNGWPRYQYATVIFFGIVLITYSLRFAHHLWVA